MESYSAESLSSRAFCQLARPMSAIGWVMIGSSISSILFASAPFDWFQPDFQLRLAGAILAASTFLLLGSLLVCCAGFLDKENKRLVRKVRLLRLLSRWFAFLLLLLIPLQILAGISVLSGLRGIELESLRQRREVINSISRFQTENDLRAYISSLPDRPPLPSKFETSFPAVKQRAIENLTAAYNRVENEIRVTRFKRVLGFWVQFAKNSIQACLVAYGFWSLRPLDRGGRMNDLLGVTVADKI